MVLVNSRYRLCTYCIHAPAVANRTSDATPGKKENSHEEDGRDDEKDGEEEEKEGAEAYCMVRGVWSE